MGKSSQGKRVCGKGGRIVTWNDKSRKLCQTELVSGGILGVAGQVTMTVGCHGDVAGTSQSQILDIEVFCRIVILTVSIISNIFIMCRQPRMLRYVLEGKDIVVRLCRLGDVYPQAMQCLIFSTKIMGPDFRK